MTIAYFKEQAAYNLWANGIVCEWITQINDAQWTQEVVSSFNSIQKTVLHIISAENAWLQRFHKISPIEWLQSTFAGTKDEHVGLWKKTSIGLQDFIDTFNEKDLSNNLDFKRLNGQAYSMPYYQLFSHVTHHSAYHRGQLVTMFRQIGFVNVTPTDLLLFYRNN